MNVTGRIRRSADTIARVTSLDALVGRPTVLWRQAKLLAPPHRDLGDAVAEVRSRLDPGAPVPDDEPLFVFSAGWRSGSTLLQRLIVSAGTHFLWGEPYNSCDLVRRLAESLLAFDARWPPQKYIYSPGTRTVGEDLSREWIANLYPPLPSLLDAHRRAIQTFLAPPDDQSERGWGMKEVRLGGEHADYLQLLFPRARFVFLVRDPVAAYTSYRDRPWWYDRWPREQVRTPSAYGRMWSRLAGSFLRFGDTAQSTLIRYEDLVRDGPVVDRLEQMLGSPVDRSVLEDRIRGMPRRGTADLSGIEARLIARTTRTVASQLGYRVASG